MAKRSPAAKPTYVAETRSSKGLTLRFPLRSGGRRIVTVRLHHPTFEQLAYLKQAEGIGAVDILTATTTLPEAAIDAMRWPDVEALLKLAMGVLPADLVSEINGDRGIGDGEREPRDSDHEHSTSGHAAGSSRPWQPGDDLAFAPAPADAPDMTEFLHRTNGLMIDG